MRWQPAAVAAALVAPPLVLAALVWPTGASADGDDDAGDDVEAELGPGDSAEGSVAGAASEAYLVVGDGDGMVRIEVVGGGFDATLTLVDPDTGEQLDFNDDTNGLDPMLLADLDDGEEVVAEVRSLGGDAGSYTITVRHDDGSGEVVPPGGPVPLPRPGPGPTVVPAEPPTTVLAEP